MAIGVDSIVAFWDDNTYDHVLLADHVDLQKRKKLILLGVFHVTEEDPSNPGSPDPNALPRLARFFSLDVNGAFIQSGNKFIVRGFDFPNPMVSVHAFIRDAEFKLDGDLEAQTFVLTDLPVVVGVVNIKRISIYKNFFDVDYQDFLDRAKAESITLFTASAPQLDISY